MLRLLPVMVLTFAASCRSKRTHVPRNDASNVEKTPQQRRNAAACRCIIRHYHKLSGANFLHTHSKSSPKNLVQVRPLETDAVVCLSSRRCGAQLSNVRSRVNSHLLWIIQRQNSFKVSHVSRYNDLHARWLIASDSDTISRRRSRWQIDAYRELVN